MWISKDKYQCEWCNEITEKVVGETISNGNRNNQTKRILGKDQVLCKNCGRHISQKRKGEQR